MGLFSSIGKFVGGAVSTVGGLTGNPILSGLGAGIKGISGGKKRPGVPAGLSSTPGFGGIPSLGVPSIPSIPLGPSGVSSGSYASGGSIGANLFAADILGVSTVTEARAPKGYRVHTVTPSTSALLGKPAGSKVAVRLGTEAARLLGVKRSKKPVLSVRDSEAIKRAGRATDRVARVAKGAGLHVYKNAPRRSTGRRK